MPKIPSPCVNHCVLEPVTGWCAGCGRSIDEIVRWGTTTPADRAAVVAALPARMARLASRTPPAAE
ncbi:DUF1289 domain-containing protein [Sphingomonas hengshuiensis]|uniref:DUF1289 domain-containing protein n=1 Tax=Sphingomonas hengshuiensis TaxID=1609977 RepID=A0A7U4LFZ4_9SPHN|nr:DUF1289 domain-containing protein [Sphingomonas hengshuiensis]AJP72965.1 hypothetical protein TS85_15945 [Sphingomonas hengshuiensis]